MFIINKTEETTQQYGRLLGKELANVAFISFENPIFMHSFKQDGDRYHYQYMMDFEFMDYLSALTHKNYPHQRNVLICIDDFPEEIRGLLRLSGDVVNAFKANCNDLTLDRLAK